MIYSYASMQATALTPEWHEKTCGYWYTVTNGAMAHTAFTTKRGLTRWLDERGLTLDGELPGATGVFATMRVVGEYRTQSHMDEGEFYAVRPIVITAAMSNADYTLALIDEHDGVRTVHTLNPNVHSRIVADHASMRALMS